MRNNESMMYTGENPEDDSENNTNLIEKGNRLKLDGHNLLNEKKYVEAKSRFQDAENVYNEALRVETDPLIIAGINKKINRIHEKFLEIQPFLPSDYNRHSIPVISEKYFDEDSGDTKNQIEGVDNFYQGDVNKQPTPVFAGGCSVDHPENTEKQAEGGDHFYEEGLDFFNKKEYDAATKMLEKSILAYNEEFGVETDLGKQAGINEKIALVHDALGKIDQILAVTNRIEACKFHKKQGNTRRAHEVLDPILANDPNNSEALSCKAHSYYLEGEYPQALEYIDRAIENAPNSSRFWFCKGGILKKIENPKDALVAFQRAVALNDTYQRAWKSIANINYNMENYTAAISACEKAKVTPGDLEIFKHWVYALLKIDRPDEARRKIQEAIDQNLADLDLRYLGASSRVYKGEYQEAIRELTYILEQDSSHSNARYYRAYSMLFTNQNYEDTQIYEEALKEVNTLLKNDPSHQDGLYLKGILLTLQNSNPEAIAIYDDISKNDPKYLNVFISKASTLFQDKKYQEAIEVVKQVLKLDPKHEGARLTLAKSYRETGDWLNARDTLDKIILQNPANYNALYLKGKILFDQEEYDLASNDFLKVLKLESTVPADVISDSKYNLATAYYKCKKWHDAINYFVEYLPTSTPNGAEAYSDLSVCYNKTGQYDLALEAANNAISLSKTGKPAYQQKANALISLGNPDDAISTYDCLTKLEPEDPDEWNSYGVLLYRGGRKKEAIQAFGKALEIDDSIDVYLYNTAIVNTDSNNTTDALKHIERAIAQRPDNAKYWYLKAIILANKKTYPEAMIAVTTALEHQPGYPDAQDLKTKLFPRINTEINLKKDKLRDRLNEKIRSYSKIPDPIEIELEEE